MKYVLKETLASERQGKPIYFRFMTEIGPCCTDDVREASRFRTAVAAMRSPAYLHPLSFFEPEMVDTKGGAPNAG